MREVPSPNPKTGEMQNLIASPPATPFPTDDLHSSTQTLLNRKQLAVTLIGFISSLGILFQPKCYQCVWGHQESAFFRSLTPQFLVLACNILVMSSLNAYFISSVLPEIKQEWQDDRRRIRTAYEHPWIKFLVYGKWLGILAISFFTFDTDPLFNGTLQLKNPPFGAIILLFSLINNLFLAYKSVKSIPLLFGCVKETCSQDVEREKNVRLHQAMNRFIARSNGAHDLVTSPTIILKLLLPNDNVEFIQFTRKARHTLIAQKIAALPPDNTNAIKIISLQNGMSKYHKWIENFLGLAIFIMALIAFRGLGWRSAPGFAAFLSLFNTQAKNIPNSVGLITYIPFLLFIIQICINTVRQSYDNARLGCIPPHIRLLRQRHQIAAFITPFLIVFLCWLSTADVVDANAAFDHQNQDKPALRWLGLTWMGSSHWQVSQFITTLIIILFRSVGLLNKLVSRVANMQVIEHIEEATPNLNP